MNKDFSKQTSELQGIDPNEQDEFAIDESNLDQELTEEQEIIIRSPNEIRKSYQRNMSKWRLLARVKAEIANKESLPL